MINVQVIVKSNEYDEQRMAGMVQSGDPTATNLKTTIYVAPSL
jgi:hypothetical protein